MLSLDEDEDKDIVFIHDEEKKHEFMFGMLKFAALCRFLLIALLSTTKKCVWCAFSVVSIMLSLYISPVVTHTIIRERMNILLHLREWINGEANPKKDEQTIRCNLLAVTSILNVCKIITVKQPKEEGEKKS